nr:DNA cytosine methyltransferase [Rhodanobacter sp. ANJX3]
MSWCQRDFRQHVVTTVSELEIYIRHPEQHRAITLREATNLQTFPTNYKFAGSLTSKAKQVGNAVPPLMAEKFGRTVVAHASHLFRR